MRASTVSIFENRILIILINSYVYLFGYSDVHNNYVLVMSVLYENILFLKNLVFFFFGPSLFATEGYMQQLQVDFFNGDLRKNKLLWQCISLVI